MSNLRGRLAAFTTTSCFKYEMVPYLWDGNDNYRANSEDDAIQTTKKNLRRRLRRLSSERGPALSSYVEGNGDWSAQHRSARRSLDILYRVLHTLWYLSLLGATDLRTPSAIFPCYQRSVDLRTPTRVWKWAVL